MKAVDKLRKIAGAAEEVPITDPMKLARTALSFSEDLRAELDVIDVPYGRFSIAENKNITVQLHLHSPGYEGQIHDHGTWGIMASLKGTFALEDWIVNTKLGTHCTRKYVMPAFGMVHFSYIEGFDWHKNTNMENYRAMSLHIYGPKHNNDLGTSYDPINDKIISRPRLKMDPVSNYGI